MDGPRKSLLTLIYKGTLAVIAFVNSALVARYLLPGDRFDFQFSGTLVQTGTTYVGGYANYYSFALPKRPQDAIEIVQMGNLFTFILSLFVWLIALVLHFVPFVHLSTPWQWALIVVPFSMMFGFSSRLLQAMNEITWLNRANLAQPLLFMLIMLPLLFASHGSESTRLTFTYLGWGASFFVTVFMTFLVAYALLWRRRVMQWRFSKKEFRGMLHYGSWSSLAQLVNYVNYRMDFWMIAILMVHDKDIASIYGIAVTASEVLLHISTSVSSVVFTRMTGGDRQDAIHITTLSARHTLISSAMVAIVMYIAFPQLILFAYSKVYAGAILPFIILLPGLIFKASGNILIQYATNAIGEPKISIWMNGVSAAINAIMCATLIPTFGMMGAALASTGSYVISYVIYVIWFARINHVGMGSLFVIRKNDLMVYVRLVSSIGRRVLRR